MSDQYKDRPEGFTISDSWLGCQVEIAYALPMGSPGVGGNVQVNYPGQRGELVANNSDSIEIVFEKVISGEKRKRRMCIPKNRIWVLERAEEEKPQPKIVV